MRWLGAILPVVMTLTVVAAGLIEGLQTGFARQPDEGTAAHLFQILMPAQVPIIAIFAAAQLPVRPRWAGWILVLQIGLAVALVAAVATLKL